MLLIIGLGNPRKKYEKTRHNVGRLVVSNWQQVERLPNFKFEKKFNALISKGTFNKNEVILALPETFMNLSGKAVKLLTRTYKLEPKNLVVVHDDIDLPLGKIKIVKNRGAAGHKGVESIIKELKTKDFIRIRIGIKPKMESASWQTKNPEKFVLQKFNKDEEKIIKEVIKKTAETVEMTIKEGLEKAMNKFNK